MPIARSGLGNTAEILVIEMQLVLAAYSALGLHRSRKSR
jgi:hypothetical protein